MMIRITCATTTTSRATYYVGSLLRRRCRLLRRRCRLLRPGILQKCEPYIHMCICMCIYIYTYIYMYIHIHIQTYIHTHVHRRFHKSWRSNSTQICWRNMLLKERSRTASSFMAECWKAKAGHACVHGQGSMRRRGMQWFEAASEKSGVVFCLCDGECVPASISKGSGPGFGVMR